MQELSKTLSELIPLVTSRTRFNAEENEEKILKQTTRLRELAHSLKSGTAPNQDPTLLVMSGMFEEDLDRALQSLKSGNREHARFVLRDTASYCIQCHTQSNNGPQFPYLNLDINAEELNPLNRAEFYAATRQFDRALDEYRKVIQDESVAQAVPFEWEQAVRSALAIVVRVKQDPKEAAAILDLVEKNKGRPQTIKQTLQAWKRSIREWSREKRTDPLSAKKKLALAERLVNRAQKSQELPLEHAQDIYYFRASSLLHDVLAEQGQSSGGMSAQALYLAGIASEATRDMNFWTLHETYYELCIKKAPQTQIAKQCFDRLHDSITLGYSGSGGVRIPPEVAKQLENLRALAFETPKAEKPENMPQVVPEAAE